VTVSARIAASSVVSKLTCSECSCQTQCASGQAPLAETYWRSRPPQTTTGFVIGLSGRGLLDEIAQTDVLVEHRARGSPPPRAHKCLIAGGVC
jgi:hypothetical protein